MKKNVFVTLAVLTLGMASCSNEEDLGITQKNVDVIGASIETVDARTTMNDKSVWWSSGDAISVFSLSGSNYSNNEYTLQTGEGTTSATFGGTLDGENPVKKVALYPYSSTAAYNGTDITLDMPVSYTYAENDNNSAPMACLIKEDAQGSLSFQNAGALLKATINNIPAGYNQVVLTSKTAEGVENATAPSITGKAKVAFDDNGTPTLTMLTENENGSTVTINFTAEQAVSNKTFYFPLAVADYPALELSLGDGTTTKILKTKALNAERGIRYSSTTTLDEVSGNVPDEVANISGANDKLENSNSVSIADVTSADGDAPTITLPDATENKSISFDKISTENEIKIEATSAKASVAEEVLVSIPQQEENQPIFVIDLPKSTVTLAANGEKATYQQVTSTTADNTLIVGNGVTVSTLIVKGGNIRINKGATVSTIQRGEGITDTFIIYKEEGAVLPSTTEGFEVVDAAVADLKKVLKDGGEYTLAQDLTGDFVVSATDATIHLGGHTITNKSGDTFTVNIGSTLTIDGSGTVDNVSNGKACIYNNGTVILNGGTYTRSQEKGTNEPDSDNGNSYYNILNHGVMTINAGVSITHTGSHSSMIASGYFNYTSGIARSGYVLGTNQANPTLTIQGGTFTGGLNTVKNDDGGNLTINNGEFKNTVQAVVQNHHIATINGGTFTPSASATYVLQSYGHAGEQDKGQTTITNGTFNGMLQLHNDDNVNTAFFKISGGTFSDPSVLTSYLVKDANVKVSLNKDYTGSGFGLYEDDKKQQYGMHATIEVDLNNHTWNVVDTPLFGSTGYESQYFHLEKGAKVTFKNGQIKPSTPESGKMLIQNYCDLLLDNITLEGGSTCQYVISNNNGSCNINSSTITAAEGQVAFDVFSFKQYAGVTVNVNNSTINGKVEFGGSNHQRNGKLVVSGGTMNGDLVVTDEYYDSSNPNIIIDGASYGNYQGWSSYLKTK